MQILIQTNDFALTPALEKFIRDKAQNALSASADRIERVSVRLKDLNGPKGGRDKECCVEVSIPSSTAVVVTKRNSDAYACLRQTLGRAARVTLRRLDRRRSRATSDRTSVSKWSLSLTGDSPTKSGIE
ncbi:MAG: HPF/RaiA family ribosome-associated protein [Arenicella sp.]|nr:HPF/RaiA family ribosome-associated protein [Arenicella sp.]